MSTTILYLLIFRFLFDLHLQYLPFSLPGFILGACCGWSELNGEELKIGLSNALGNIDLADVLLELSKYTNLEGEYRSYGSRLFSSILWAEHVIREKQGLDVYFEKIKSLIKLKILV